MKAKRRTMLAVIAGVWVAVCFGHITGFAAQLPPDVLVDKFLLQAKTLSEEKNHMGALEAMKRIVALQEEHDLTLPEAFPFHYAQTALAAGAVQAAIDSANRYLSVAGREGKHYREVLELLVKAERMLREPVADPAEPATAGPEIEPQPQAAPLSLPETRETAEAQPAVDCTKWNSSGYFRKATAESVTACLKAGVDPMARDDYRRTPLRHAVRYSDNLAKVRLLLDSVDDPRTVLKWTPLHKAALFNENPAVIEALLKAGADPMARDKWEYTPLHYAARFNKNPAVIQALLQAGDNKKKQLKRRNDDGGTPLHLAARNTNPEVAKLLITAGADMMDQGGFDNYVPPPLHIAAEVENAAVVKAMLNAGASPKKKFREWQGPLHIAAHFNNKPDVVRLLLDAGADPNRTVRYNMPETPRHGMGRGNVTPLHVAAAYNDSPAVIDTLVKHGADLEARDKWKYTPLHHAAHSNENPAVIQTLLQAGADLAALDKKGRSALHLANESDNAAARQVLIAAGADRVERQIAVARRERQSQSGGGGGLGALIAGATVGVAAASVGASVEEAASAAATVAGDVLQAEQAQQRSRQTATSPVRPSALSGAGGIGGAVGSGPCEIPGYPRPADPQSLGLSWCPASVDFQVRVFALTAAGANCAIALGTSSTPEQIQARRRDIKGYCERLEALDQGLGGNGECLCPPGWGGTRSNVDRAGAKPRDADLEDAKGVESDNQEEEARQRQRLRMEENNRDVLNSDCTCISIDDQTGKYACMDGFVSDGRSGKPTCDIRR